MKMQGWVKLQCMGFCVLMRVSLSCFLFFPSLLLYFLHAVCTLFFICNVDICCFRETRVMNSHERLLLM